VEEDTRVKVDETAETESEVRIKELDAITLAKPLLTLVLLTV